MENSNIQRFRQSLERSRMRQLKMRAESGEKWLGLDDEKRTDLMSAVEKANLVRASYRKLFLNILHDAEVALKSCGIPRVSVLDDQVGLKCEDPIGFVHEMHLLQVGDRLYALAHLNNYVDGWLKPVSNESSDFRSVPFGPRSDAQRQLEMERFAEHMECFLEVIGSKLK